ncbi:hypothetical protein BJ742DRAFT_798838 [Cladochytrium replicatum]|nr:hypothetical protein BJ742DRAFT_798838 [Cladochytrium replicatum]
MSFKPPLSKHAWQGTNTTSLGSLRGAASTTSMRDENGFAEETRSKRHKSKVVSIGGQQLDITELKRNVIRQRQLKMSKSSTRILNSDETDEFIIRAVSYLRWHLIIHQMEVARERTQRMAGIDPTMNFSGKFGDFLKNSALSNDDEGNNPIENVSSLDAAKSSKKAALRHFGNAYCFLLLLVSKSSSEPAKERSHFEMIYMLTREISIQLLPAGMVQQIYQELERVFRSNLFAQKYKPHAAIHSKPGFATTIANTGLSPGGNAPTSFPLNTTYLKTNAGASAIVPLKPTQPGNTPSNSNIPNPNTEIPEATPAEQGESDEARIQTLQQEQNLSLLHQGVSPGINVLRTVVENQCATRWRKKISLNDVRMARSPLADAVLPPPQRFLFVQRRSSALESLG